ncbi:MAG: dTDP-4-dehydrorhamnose reductase [Pseudomonadota bacterium]
MKVLITGAQGMLGNDLRLKLQDICELWTRDIQDFDICDREKVACDIKHIRPDVVINCAAFTDVDASESRQEKAFAVNAEGVQNIALACRESGSLLYHISTDYVFDGQSIEPHDETYPTNPFSVYGKSKLAGELHVQNILKNHVIIRTSWLFGKHGNNFVSTIVKLSSEKDEIHIVNDQTGCPTYTVDLAEAITLLLSKPAQGIYHFCNSGVSTWYSFAEKIIGLLGRTTKVLPLTTQQLGRPAPRPAFSVLNCSKFIAETGMHPRSWEAVLKEYLLC